MNSAIRRIVDRCHVGESNRKVIRYFVSRLKAGHRTWRSLTSRQRRGILRDIIKTHALNRKVYLTVTSGRF